MTPPWPLLRGRVYAARLAGFEEDKYFLVVSNNRRNRALPQVLAVRLTTTRKPPLPSIVTLESSEVFVASVVCDDIVENLARRSETRPRRVEPAGDDRCGAGSCGSS